MNTRRFVVALAVALLFVAGAYADEDSHIYEDNEEVIVWANKIGPYNNPQETYAFYDAIPLCPPPELEESRFEGLGESLQGYELVKSNLKINFKDRGVNKKEFCRVTVDEDVEEKLSYAVLNKYWFEFFIDDLPVWGFVGETSTDESKELVYSHFLFSISYNEDRIIEVKLTQDSPVPIKQGVNLVFRYTVQWNPTDIEFEHRFDRYLDDKFFEHQVHWFSIFNSFMMVFFLAGLVVLILLRTLKQDYAKYSKDEDEEDGLEGADDGGWKMVHGDVFRAPPNLSIFSALIGTGTQLVILAFCLIFLSVGFYHERGSIVTSMIVCYAFTSFISGYVGGSYYVKNGGKHWIKTLLYTALLLPGVVSGVAFFLNWIAVAYGSLAAIPFSTMVVVVLIWSFVSLPLVFFGTIIGRNWAGSPDAPCRVAPVPRLIPDKAWYQEPMIHVILGGILPFGSIFIEMYFVFTAFWQYKYYYVFGFLFLVYVIMILVSICVTIVSTYFLLNSEDYRWQWTSFGTGFSTGGYVFLYAIYYFLARTHMSGFMQTTFYFGYMFLFCLAIGLVCGGVGFLGSEMFVRRIYRNIKID